MTAVDNEKLCALAQNGNMDALNSLVENNLRFIKMTAHEIWSAQIEVNRALGVTFDDLVQEGCLGLMGCVEKFNPDGGNKFLTYAAPAIRNSMIDYIRSQSTSFEAKHMGEIVSLDEVTKFENRDRHAFVPDSNMTNPAQIYIAKETHEELHAALDAISNREREYLLYRFGFEDNIEHPLTETAEHFFLSESRAKSTERLYTSCAPVVTENLSAQLQAFLCQLHTNRRILLMLNPSFCVPFSPQNPPVLLPPKSVCLAWDSPFPASAVAKGITH